MCVDQQMCVVACFNVYQNIERLDAHMYVSCVDYNLVSKIVAS